MSNTFVMPDKPHRENNFRMPLISSKSLFEDSYVINSKEKPMQIGDHLSSPRHVYSHHGIFMGEDRVIHYSGFVNGISSGCIEITSLNEFSNGNDVFIHIHKYRKHSGIASIERAQGRIGEDWYNVLLNNCEHFVYWCIMGVHKSEQVNSAIILLSEAATTFNKNSPNNNPSVDSPEIIVKLIEVKKTFSSVNSAEKIINNSSSSLNSISGTAAAIGAGAGTAVVIGASAGTTAAVSTGIAGIAASIGGGSALAAAATVAAPLVATAAAAAVVGYGVKKLVDLILD